MTSYQCAECSGSITTADDLITINVMGHAKAAHRNCPPKTNMKVTWTTTTVGTMNAFVPDDELFEFLKNLSKLGYTPEVTMEE